MLHPTNILSSFDPLTGAIPGAVVVERRLSQLRGCFHDAAAYEKALHLADPLLYRVTAVEPANGEGALHYGAAVIMPGRIGDEYYMTKGHLHAWRDAAEVYIGLRGEGMMLLEDEDGPESRMVPLRENSVVYVPGKTAHRTINTGSVPLTYLGVYPAKAGHDYAAIAAKNFRSVVVERDGQPTLIARNKL